MRSKKRSWVVVARVVKKRRSEGNKFVTHVEKMSQSVADLVKSMIGDKKEAHNENLMQAFKRVVGAVGD